VAERIIRELQNLARTMLVHAQQGCPEAVTTNLWPYAIRMANDSLNATPSMQHHQKATPELLFTNTITTKYWHHFGCPALVLAKPLQSSQNIYHKWKSRSKVRVYLGRSPKHYKEIA
jgi:hypothetical protein